MVNVDYVSIVVKVVTQVGIVVCWVIVRNVQMVNEILDLKPGESLVGTNCGEAMHMHAKMAGGSDRYAEFGRAGGRDRNAEFGGRVRYAMTGWCAAANEICGVLWCGTKMLASWRRLCGSVRYAGISGLVHVILGHQWCVVSGMVVGSSECGKVQRGSEEVGVGVSVETRGRVIDSVTDVGA